MATNAQPFQQLLATQGIYPESDVGMSYNYQAMVQTFAGMVPIYGAPAAAGQVIPAGKNPTLCEAIGFSYGGGGSKEFAYPNLIGRVAVGGAPGTIDGETLAMTYMIAFNGMAGSPRQGLGPPTGAVALFAGAAVPGGWLACEGQLLEIADFPGLHAVIGAGFGGDGSTTFALPDLRGAAVVGTGPGVALGQPVSADGIDGLGLNYLIATGGAFPDESGDGEFPSQQFFTAQVIAYAGADIPAGWSLADGSVLTVQGNSQLYALVGNTYGGQGTSNFALPDLRGRVVTGREL